MTFRISYKNKIKIIRIDQFLNINCLPHTNIINVILIALYFNNEINKTFHEIVSAIEFDFLVMECIQFV